MITFEQLLTDPKYREMSEEEIANLINSDKVLMSTVLDIKSVTDPSRFYTTVSKPLYLHLQKLKAESEKKPKQDFDTAIKNAVDIINSEEYMNSVLDKFKAKVEQDTNKAIENFWNPIHKSIKFTPNEHPIQITDQKAREIAAKYFNCNPNEIKIL